MRVMNLIHLAWLCVFGASACSSGHEGTGGKPEHPPRPVASQVVAVTPSASIPAPSASVPPAPTIRISCENVPAYVPPPSFPHEPTAKVPTPPGRFTPLDRAITADCEPAYCGSCRPRPWSTDVPDGACKADGECGDGFCDRGRCAAIWGANERYGQRCIHGKPPPIGDDPDDECSGICLDGRCRSCTSDAECIKARGNQYAKCMSHRNDHPGRICTIDDPKMVPSIGPTVGSP